MKKTVTFSDAPAMRSPYKLILIVALFIPAASALTVGWGMLFCEYHSMNSALFLSLKNVLEVLYQVVRFAALACTFMTIGFIAGKRGFTSALAPTGTSILCGAGVSAVSLGILALMMALGFTDQSGYTPFGKRFMPYLMSALVDLLILALVEIVVIVFFSLVASGKGRRRMLYKKSPFMITAYIIFAAYTLITMSDAIVSVRSYTSDQNFFVICILPFLFRLFYGGVMVVAGNFFRQILYIYFYEHGERAIEKKQKKNRVKENEPV